MFRVTATNGNSSTARLFLGESKLIAGGTTYHAHDPDKVIRALGTFTWDFLIYSVIDFHPITAVVDASLFLTGPLYNRRLKRQLAQLSNGELYVLPGQSRSALLAFRGVPKKRDRLVLQAAEGENAPAPYEIHLKSA